MQQRRRKASLQQAILVPRVDLRARDTALLVELSRQSGSHVAFQGLKRRLDLHPQALERVLSRLEGIQLVEKSAEGYAITAKGLDAVAGRAEATPPKGRHTLIRAALPPGVTMDGVSKEMAHRWFQGLRWYGESHRSGGTTLTWLTEPNAVPLNLQVGPSKVSIELDEEPPHRPEEYEAVGTIIGALSELYRRPGAAA